MTHMGYVEGFHKVLDRGSLPVVWDELHKFLKRLHGPRQVLNEKIQVKLYNVIQILYDVALGRLHVNNRIEELQVMLLVGV